ncbi:MAG: hypothetical protein HPY82_23660 [Gammaproteobacteria bacterium]|nr:hypothetical protein [Gammaproteobacteria bacterium]
MSMTENRGQRVTFFPIALPDETIFSILNRFHQRSGLLCVSSTTNLLFGKEKFKFSSELLTAIPQLSLTSNIPSSQLICQHSSAPFYSKFFNSSSYNHFEKCLQLEKGEIAVSIISLISNRTAAESNLKCCPACVLDDKATFGVSYWHCEHQLPGMSCCIKHCLVLNETPKTKYRLSSPPKNGVSIPAIKQSGTYRYSSLALSCYQYEEGFLDRKRLYKTYFDGLGEKSMLTVKKRLRLNKLNESIFHHWHDIIDHKSFNRFNPLDNLSGFPESLFYKPNANHHPIKHLLLIGYLFGNWHEFISQFNSTSRKISNTILSNPNLDENANRKQHASMLLHAGKSIRDVSVDCKLSLSTLNALAEREGIKKPGKHRSISGDKKRLVWRKLMIGKSTKSIAIEFNIAQSSVQYLLAAHPYLYALREKIRLYQCIQEYRKTIQRKINANPNFGRSDLQKAEPAAFTWLRRHDKEWLYSTLPPAIPRAKRCMQKRNTRKS